MRLLRGLAGALLWILALVLALVAVIVCVTVILLPVGIPLLGYAGRLFAASFKLMLPRAVSHPVDTASDALKERGHRAQSEATKTLAAAKSRSQKLGKRSRKNAKSMRKKLPLVS